MAINKISGNILADNLQRGANLAIQGNLIYFDVTNNRIGIKKSSPTVELDVSGNVLANNISSSGLMSATGNITGGNVLTSGLLSVTGNITAGNVLTSGLVSATGNITGGNLISSALVQGVTVSASGNIVGGNANITSAVNSSTVNASGNIVGGNVTTAGLISAAGNLTAGNIRVGNIILPGIGNINAGNVNINNVSNPVANSDAATKFYVDTSVPQTGNITFSNTTIGTASANTNINLMPTGNGVVVIDTVTGLVVPVGNTAQRPATPDSGTVRLNNSNGLIEFYNGVGWVSLSSAGGITITNQTINPNGIDISYTLDQTATAASVMVTINGVTQTPDIDYSVSSTTITFGVIPIPTDIIQIRFLAGVTSTNFLTNASGNAEVLVDSTGNITLQASSGQAINTTGNLLITGLVSATGNIAGNYVLGNGAYLTGLTPGYGNSNVAAYLPTYSGNISGSNISVTGNVTGGNVLFGSGVVSGTGNVNGNIVTATTLNATTVSASGNVTSGNLSVGTGAVSIGSIVNNNANGVGNIGSSSKYFNTIFATATTALYADLSEKFTSDSDYPSGTVVVFGGNKQVTVATTYADPHAAGIVSTDPAYLMNAGLTETAVSLALAGQVPCFVMGPVHKGDLLTTSDTEGYACKLDPKDWQPGVAIGKALENCSTGPHKINVLAINS